MLTDALPGLRHSMPGNIQDPATLPELRNLVVVDNDDTFLIQREKLGVTSTIDWREIMIWREDTREQASLREMRASLHKDDVINLQFTR